MKKIVLSFAFLTFSLILAGCAKNINNNMKLTIDNKTYRLEEARTDAEKSKGLSGRQNLDADAGMIFYFDKPDYLSFWMKDTLIPLQIIFVNGCEIVDIQEMAVESDPTNPQKTYKSKMIADKAIELNANSVQEYIGQKINNLCK